MTGVPPEPDPPAAAARQALDRWKKEDAIHKALMSINRLIRFDAEETAQFLSGVDALPTFVTLHTEIAEAGVAWLSEYARALGERSGHDEPKLRSMRGGTRKGEVVAGDEAGE